MKNALIVLTLSLLSFGALHAQTTPRCEDSETTDFSFPNTRDIEEHVVPSDGGDHHFITNYDVGCHYQSTATGPTQYCVTTSFVQASITEQSETGELTNLIDEHFIGANAQGGIATGVNGATATSGGLGAGAVKDCLPLFGCNVTVTVSGSNDGVGLSVSFPPSTLWQKNAPARTQSCGPVLDPTFTPPPPPPPPPPPQCDPDAPQELRFGTGNDNNPCASPIIIDTTGNGFQLTSVANGVLFDIAGNGTPIHMGWTGPGSGNAFLALPGSDGLVHNGKELFGNFTSQPASVHPNGFLALAEYDKPENGGNGDGVIDEKDMVFSRLRLWIDENHDGICQPNELYQLSEMNIYSLSLGYFTSSRTDNFGNKFRYKARVNPDDRRDKLDETPTGEPGRWAYDVFFATK